MCYASFYVTLSWLGALVMRIVEEALIPTDYIPLLLQAPLVGAFIIFTLRLDQSHVETVKHMTDAFANRLVAHESALIALTSVVAAQVESQRNLSESIHTLLQLPLPKREA